MVLNEGSPDPSASDRSLLAGHKKWAVNVGMVVLKIAFVGLWLSSVLDETGVLPVFAIAIAVLGGAGSALWLIEA
jgi:hypothetical protein